MAHYLNCPQVRDEELMACLKNRSVKDLLSARIEKPKYVPAFAPLVDSAVIPDKPANLMKNAERLARYTRAARFALNIRDAAAVSPRSAG